jgi:hypothetical protein
MQAGKYEGRCVTRSIACKLAQTVKLLTCIRRAPISNLCRDTGYLTEGFLGFTHDGQASPYGKKSLPLSLFLYSWLFLTCGSVCSHLLTLVPCSRIFLSWRWRRYVPPKRRLTQDLHSATFQKTTFFIVTAVKASNHTKIFYISELVPVIGPLDSQLNGRSCMLIFREYVKRSLNVLSICVVIMSRVWVTIDGVWIGNWIYWILTEPNYK